MMEADMRILLFKIRKQQNNCNIEQDMHLGYHAFHKYKVCGRKTFVDGFISQLISHINNACFADEF